jgi:hypothetical protein
VRSFGFRSALAGLLAFAALAGLPQVGRADIYDPMKAGHPLRILGYALHPVGVLLDYAIMRPCHWLGHQEPLKTIFGHRD